MGSRELYDTAWMDDAACTRTDPDSFTPVTGPPSSQVRRTCQGCPVRADCLAWALVHDERYGVWGGLTYPERRRLA